MKIVKPRGPEIFDIELEKDLLAKNKSLAKEYLTLADFYAAGTSCHPLKATGKKRLIFK